MTERQKKLVENNIKLAYYIAKKWSGNYGIDKEEALSAAQYGLVKAAIGFTEERGVKFATYAARVMENEIRQQLRKDRRKRALVSLEEEMQGTEGLAIKDMIKDKTDWFTKCETELQIRMGMNILTRREKEVLTVRLKNTEKTQAECGQMIGISQSAFSRYLLRARKKIGV